MIDDDDDDDDDTFQNLKHQEGQATELHNMSHSLPMVGAPWDGGPLTIKPIYTLYSGYLLGPNPLLTGSNRGGQGYHHFPYDGPIFFLGVSFMLSGTGFPSTSSMDFGGPLERTSHLREVVMGEPQCLS